MDAEIGALVKEMFGQVAFVSSIVAGFALTVFVQLLAMRGGRRRLRSVVTALFLVAAIGMLAGTFAAVALSMNLGLAGARGEAAVDTTYARNMVVGIVLQLGIPYLMGNAALVVGLALLGFLHSRAVGIVGASCTLIATLSMFGYSRWGCAAAAVAGLAAGLALLWGRRGSQ